MQQHKHLAGLAAVFGLIGLFALGAHESIGERAVHAQSINAALYPVFSQSHITSNATTAALTGAGVLHTFCINKVGSSSNVATVYDSLSAAGTVIAVIDTTGAGNGCYQYDVALSTGLTVVTATGTAGDYTVTYRRLGF